MADENAPTPAQVPTPATVPAENPPPAAKLVVHGEKSEREIELEGLLADRDEKLSAADRRALEAERKAAELERKNQDLMEIPAPQKPPKVKRQRDVADIILGNDGDED